MRPLVCKKHSLAGSLAHLENWLKKQRLYWVFGLAPGFSDKL
jgi:hypothetical protein